MNPHCVCSEPGYCERHQMVKIGRLYKLCKGTVDTKDCGKKYFEGWENGQLGAVAPEDPITEFDWDCDNENALAAKSMKTDIRHRTGNPIKTNPPAKRKSEGPGTELHKLLSSVGIHLKSGCKCQWWIDRMNSGGPDWCKLNVDEIVENMLKEGKKRGWKILKGPTKALSGIVAKRFVLAAIKRAIKNGG